MSKREERNNNCYCFGEYGTNINCDECPNRLVCKQFTYDRQKDIYLRSKEKYKGRGKFRKKDVY